MLNENELTIVLSPNFSVGRQGTPVRHITFHHVVGSANSAVSKFSNSASQVSAHFVVGADKVYCCVDTDNTAWTNGVWASNLESVTIEHEGTWLNGFRDENVLNNSARLVAWLRTLYPNATPNRHRDILATACPGELPVEEIWARASEILSPTPVVVPIPEPVVVPTPVVETPVIAPEVVVIPTPEVVSVSTTSYPDQTIVVAKPTIPKQPNWLIPLIVSILKWLSKKIIGEKNVL